MGTLKSCPLCRAPPAVGEEVQKKWIKERAAEGRAWAQFNLGNFYRECMVGFPYKTSTAMKWYKLAAEQHFPDALYTLGMIYYNGIPCMASRSYSAAFPLFKEAAEDVQDHNRCLVLCTHMGKALM